MNYLAHLYLSGNNEDVLIGNFIADSVKGSKYKDYTSKIQQGILYTVKLIPTRMHTPILELAQKDYIKITVIILE